MRSDHNSVSAGLEGGQVFEGADLFAGLREVDQQHVTAVDGPLDPRKEGDAALPRVGGQPPIRQLPVVQGNRQGVEAQLDRPVDQG